MSPRKQKDKKRPSGKVVPHQKPQIRPKKFVLKDSQYHLEHAREYPIYGCWMDKRWQEEERGLVQLVVAREHSGNRLAFGIYMVDLYCLGVKECAFAGDYARGRFERQMAGLLDNAEECTVEEAHSIIYGALEYARKYGFDPHKTFEEAQLILDPPDTYPIPDDLEFGRDGKPMFIAGPYDDVDKVLATLERTAGEGNYDFLAPVDMPEDLAEKAGDNQFLSLDYDEEEGIE